MSGKQAPESGPWRDRFARLVAAGVDALGPEEVLAALADEADRLAPDQAGPEPLSAIAPVLGVSSCAAGWVGVLVVPGDRPTVQVAATLAAAVEHARGQVAVEVVAIGWDPEVPDQAQGEEARAWIEAGTGTKVIEIRPASSRQQMVAAGVVTPGWFAGFGFTQAELIAACAAAWTASRHVIGVAETPVGSPVGSLGAGVPVLV